MHILLCRLMFSSPGDCRMLFYPHFISSYLLNWFTSLCIKAQNWQKLKCHCASIKHLHEEILVSVQGRLKHLLFRGFTAYVFITEKDNSTYWGRYFHASRLQGWMGSLNFLRLVFQKINSMRDSWTDKSQTLLKFKIRPSYSLFYLHADEPSSSSKTIIYCGVQKIIIKIPSSLNKWYNITLLYKNICNCSCE